MKSFSPLTLIPLDEKCKRCGGGTGYDPRSNFPYAICLDFKCDWNSTYDK